MPPIGGHATDLDDLAREARVFILDVMSQGRLRTDGIITHRFSLDQVPEAWEFIDTRRAEYLTVAFEGRRV